MKKGKLTLGFLTKNEVLGAASCVCSLKEEVNVQIHVLLVLVGMEG